MDAVHSAAWPWEKGFDPRSVTAPPNGYVRQPHSSDRLIQLGLDHSTARGDANRNATGTKRWHLFCESLGQCPDRPLDPMSPVWAKLEEEWLCMRFCCALVETMGNTPKTAAAYFGHAQSWHRVKHGIKLAGGVKMERLPAMLKGLRRLIGSEPQKVRRGVAAHALRQAMDVCLDPTVPAHANMRAALALGFQGLLRSAEFAVDSGKRWNERMNLSRADVQRCDDKVLAMMIHPCKNMTHLEGKTCPLVIGAGGDYIDAAAEMANLLRVDPIPEGRRASTPLFRDPASGLSITTEAVRDMVKGLMQKVGEDPYEFGSHSLRIGGATALFAAGANPTIIRTMGRWSSDLYKLYVRASFEQTVAWSRKAGSMKVQDLAGIRDFDEVDDY